MKKIYADLLLLLTAILWGSTFVFQKMAINMYAFNFNALRFFVASVVMAVLYMLFGRKHRVVSTPKKTTQYAGIISGALLALSINLQQIALIESSVGKAGFLTGLYVVLVPLVGVFLKHSVTVIQWISTVLAIVGLYFMSIHGALLFEVSDILLVLGAVVWAVYILYIEHVSKQYNTLHFAMKQYFFSSVFSFITGVLLFSYTYDASFDTSLSFVQSFAESFMLLYRQALHTWIPILYAAIVATSIGFSLQIYAQRYTSPTHTSLIVSLEAVFAAVFGALLLHETMKGREIMGASLIFTAMILSQVFTVSKKKQHS